MRRRTVTVELTRTEIITIMAALSGPSVVDPHIAKIYEKMQKALDG